MAAKNLLKIQRLTKYLIQNFSSKKTETNSIWNLFKSNKDEKPKPPIECCKKRQGFKEDPDLSHLGGQAYRTCGSAYIVQKDRLPPVVSEPKDEDEILKKIEADLTTKETVYDPLPPFKSVEQRMIDLTEKKLHPFYKRYFSLPKRDIVVEKELKLTIPPYKCKVGPITDDEIPEILKINKDLLEKKNIFADYKKVELPKQMLARMIEIEKNRKPTLEKKAEEKKK